MRVEALLPPYLGFIFLQAYITFILQNFATYLSAILVTLGCPPFWRSMYNFPATFIKHLFYNLKAAFQLRVFHTHLYARKSLTVSKFYTSANHPTE